MDVWASTLHHRLHLHITTAQFAVAAALLTLGVTAAAAWAYLDPAKNLAVLILLAIQAAIAFNAVVPHLSLFLFQRRTGDRLPWT